jgi:RNA polymerase sigma factor (sigma-70 family)
MATSPMSEFIRHLRSALLPDGADLTDGHLLECFVSGREPAALEALVHRHGPMVWGVCRRILLNPHDAEDAFQATFLVLVRKAASIRCRAKVGNWLYGVAHQTALKAKAIRAKRKMRETQMTDMPEPGVAEHDSWSDLQAVLDEELSRLPEKHRTVIVLCDLEGKTIKEVARQLGFAQGTVASRLARGRGMLAKRLTRRGVTVSGAILAAVLSEQAATAALPSSVMSSTIKTVTLVAAGQATATALVSAKVAALTEGMMKAMLLTKLKITAALVVVIALTVLGVGHAIFQTPATEPAKEPQANQKPQATKADAAKTRSPLDLRKIQPPGGVPLLRSRSRIVVYAMNRVRKRLEAAPKEDLDRWIVELERLIDQKLKDGLPSPRQVCRTDFVTKMSVAFDDLKWNAKTADNLFQRARTMSPSEIKAWKKAFEAFLKKEIGQTDTEVLDGGPTWAIPFVLIPVDALHEGQTYSAERGKKYRTRLMQLTAEDVALWKSKVDQFGGAELDAAVNIVLLDYYFEKEKFQRDKFKATIEQLDAKKKAPAKEEKAETDKLHGTWQLVSLELDGLRVAEGRSDVNILARLLGERRPEPNELARLRIEQKSLTLWHTPAIYDPEAVNRRSAMEQAVIDFAVDATQSPKVIVLTWKECPWNGAKDFVRKAIYSVEGDRLNLCLSRKDEDLEAPTEFSAKAGSGRLLWTFQRDLTSK